jgi:hypothetical protein
VNECNKTANRITATNSLIKIRAFVAVVFFEFSE